MRKIFILANILFLWTCGGGGGSSPTEPQEPAPVSNFTATPTTLIQGQAVTFTSTSTGTVTGYSWNVDDDPAIEGTTATYEHTYTEVGSNSVTLTVTGPGGSNSKTIADMITVASAAPTPTTNTSQTTQEDNAITISLTATDPNGETVTFAITTDPSNGTATLSGGDVTYTPNTNFYGTDSFDYTASNGTYTSDPVTITVSVEGEDDGDPTTNDVSATTDEDTVVTVDLDATEIDGDNYSFSIISQPTNGTLGSVNGNQVEYTPNQDWNGTDTFTFEATDDRTARMNVATATITVNAVNDAPTTNDVSATIDENRTARIVDITLDGSDIEGDALTYSLVTNPSNGTASISGATLTYTANQDWNGTETFTYKANDGTVDSNTANINITVNAVNDAPTTSDQTVTVNEDEVSQITMTGANDVDGDNLTYTVLNVSVEGSFSHDGSSNTGTFTPTPNANGDGGTFTYKVNDGTTDSNIATVTIAITAINDAPTTSDQTVTVNEDEVSQITLTGADVDGDNLTYTVVSGPSNGNASIAGSILTYAANQDWNGTETITYKANDGTVDSNTSTITITVNAVNDAPVTTDIATTIDENRTARMVGIALQGTDVDGDNLTYTVVSGPSNGNASIAGSILTYAANQDWNGTETITYKANDGTVDSNTSTITITVNAVNDAPTTSDQTVTVNEDEVSQITLTGADVDGDNLTYTVVSGPSNGNASIAGSILTYAANQDWNGTETITYKANDGTVDSNTSTITITVNAVNDAPVTTDIATTIDENRTARMVGIALQGTDVDGDNLTYTVVSGPSNGNASIAGSILTYAANQDWNGTETITYKANDGTVDSNTSTITITVNAVNDAPTVTTETLTTAYETAIDIDLSTYSDDIDGDALTYTITQTTSNGSLSLSGTGIANYTPNTGFDGQDQFNYIANDGTVDSNTGTIFINVQADDTPTSSFTADETTGFTPLRVVFTNSSTNSTSYAWDFGDGNTSTDTSPTHTFSTAGTYTVSLTATGSGGSDSSTETITVNALPNSSLITDPKYIINNSTSSFDIKVNQVTNLTSAQLVLNIPAGMSVDAVTAGAFLEGNTAPLMILTDNVSSDGTYSISISSLSSDLQSASGDGTLVSVTFTNNNSASSNITFNSNTKFLDNDGNTISINQAIGVFLVVE